MPLRVGVTIQCLVPLARGTVGCYLANMSPSFSLNLLTLGSKERFKE